MIARFVAKQAAGDGFHWGIWQQDGLAGGVICHYINRGDLNAELGYWLGADFTGKGLATRASASAVEHLLRQEKLHRLEMICGVANTRSRAVAERLGFTNEGVRRESYWITDRFADHVVYGLLAREWRREPGWRGAVARMSETQSVLQLVVLLLSLVLTLGAFARRLPIPYPIVLVLGGLVLSFVPGPPERAARAGPDLHHLPAPGAVGRGVRERPAAAAAQRHADRAPGGRPRGRHHRRCGVGGPPHAAGHRLVVGVHPRRRGVLHRRGRGHGRVPPARHPAPAHRPARGREPAQRRQRPGALHRGGHRARHRRVLRSVRAGRLRLRCARRDHGGHRRGVSRSTSSRG